MQWDSWIYLMFWGLDNVLTNTHTTKGNNLDLILLNSDAEFKLVSVKPRDFISDHHFVTGYIELEKEKQTIKTTMAQLQLNKCLAK